MRLKSFRAIFAGSVLMSGSTFCISQARAASTREEAARTVDDRLHKEQEAERIRNNALAAIADPSKGPEDIRKALEGGSVELYGSNFSSMAAEYIYDARAEVLNSVNKQAAPEQAQKIMECMARDAEKKKAAILFSLLAGIGVAVVVGVYLGSATYNNRKSSHNRPHTPPPRPSIAPQPISRNMPTTIPAPKVPQAPADFDDVVANLQGRQDRQPQDPQP